MRWFVSNRYDQNVPWWFWGIVVFQLRGVITVLIAIPLKDKDLLMLIGLDFWQAFSLVALGIPALFMVGLYSLRRHWPRLLRFILVLMVMVALIDIIRQGIMMLFPITTVDMNYTQTFIIVFNLICAIGLVSNACLRQIFWSHHWQWY